MKKFARFVALMLCVIMACTILTACPPPTPEPPVEKITVTFKANNQTQSTRQVTKGDAVGRPSVNPPSTDETKEFDHWYATDVSIPFKFSTKLYEDTTINAYFITKNVEDQINHFTVTYYNRYDETAIEEERFKDPIVEVKLNIGEDVNDPIIYHPQVTGEALEYWSDATGKVDFPIANLDRDIKVYAVMSTAYTVEFMLYGGEWRDPLEPTRSISGGQKIAKPADPIPPAGSKFVSWITKTSAVFNFENTPITKNTKLYAKYERENINEPSDKMLIVNNGELDGILNPFFASSAYDMAVYGQTQVSLLGAGADGKVDVGTHVPTVAQNYSMTTYAKNSDGVVIENPTDAEATAHLGNDSYKKDPDYYWTDYKFLIKNNIYFDEHDKLNDTNKLTIKDVIFNLYVLLDPSYSGSNTLYSTPIVGLNDYRVQERNSEGGSSSDKQTYVASAYRRMSNFVSAYKDNEQERTEFFNYNFNNEAGYQALVDAQTLRNNYYKEIARYYTSAESTPMDEKNPEFKSGYVKEKLSTAAELFALRYNLITVTYKSPTEVENVDRSGFNTVMNNMHVRIPEVKQPKENATEEEEQAYYNYLQEVKLTLLNHVFNSMCGVTTAEERTAQVQATGRTEIDLDFGEIPAGTIVPNHNNVRGSKHVILDTREKDGEWVNKARSMTESVELALDDEGEPTNLPSLNAVLSRSVLMSFYINSEKLAYQTMVGVNVIAEWTQEEEAKVIEQKIAESGKVVPTITGITVEALTKDDVFDGQNEGTTVVDDEQYVLGIKITGVDPKAIWNFSASITPMSYYSNSAGKNRPSGVSAEDWAKLVLQDYTSFNYPGCPGFDEDKLVSPGFATHSIHYFNGILKNPDIMAMPRGAGPFKASTDKFSEDLKDIIPSEFVKNNFVNYTANKNFYTVAGTGKASGEVTSYDLTNVQFNKMRYQVIETTRVLPTLANKGGIHYGDVNAKEENLIAAQTYSHLTALKLPNNGYGYVGINAKYVPNLNVRRAIMTAMNTNLVKTYYGSMADTINRPMTTNSWAYPTDAAPVYPYTGVDTTKETILNLIATAHEGGNGGIPYTKVNGVWQRPNPAPNANGNDRLSYTFTIAGAETDHPAYSMFTLAADILNDCGFEIKVVTDNQALIKLAEGSLHVWAAAWGSTIDPDMYQIYHPDSRAQSTNNWGYRYWFDDGNITSAEAAIVNKLKIAIEQGRSVNDQEARKRFYSDALNAVMELAVEYPTYQRYNLIVYNHEVIDYSTLNSNMTIYSGPMDKIWQVRIV